MVKSRPSLLALCAVFLVAQAAEPVRVLAQTVRVGVPAASAATGLAPVRVALPGGGVCVQGTAAPLQILPALPALSPLPKVSVTPGLAAAPSASPSAVVPSVEAAQPAASPSGSASAFVPLGASAAARPEVRPVLEAAGALAAEVSAPGAGRADASALETRWRSFWSRSRNVAGSAAVEGSLSPLRPTLFPASSSRGARTLALAAALPAPLLAAKAKAVALLPGWALSALKAGAPYLQGGGVLLVTWAATWAASKVLNAFWKWRGFEPNSLVATRLLADVALWATGATIALKVAGMDWTTLLAGLGIGGLAVTMALKKFLGNLIHGVILLFNHPFRLREKVRIGSTDYVVRDMTFRYVVLEKEPGTHTLMDYTQLSSQPLRLYRQMETSRLREDAPAAETPAAPAPTLLRRTLRLGGGAALAGLAWFLHGALLAARPFIYALAGFAATALLARLSGAFLRRLAARRGWNPDRAGLVRTVVNAFIYLVGGAVSLALAGVSWSALLTGAGALGVAAGVAATDFLSNLLEASWILATQPFKVGDRIRVGDEEGVVSDMTLRYVVLETAQDGSPVSILLPYALIGSSTVTVLKDYVKSRSAR
ncbi:MAG: mechanosensitive ion channel domain-containing protein [Elusimicrobiota bacterium]|jgi:small-conductance mechanosensitive channel